MVDNYVKGNNAQVGISGGKGEGGGGRGGGGGGL